MTVSFPDYFPAECYLSILEYLSIKDLSLCSRVCKLWDNLAASNAIWFSLAKRDCPPFPKEPSMSWKQYYKLNHSGSPFPKIYFIKKELIAAWGKTIGIWRKIHGDDSKSYRASYIDTRHAAKITCSHAFESGPNTYLVTGSRDKTLKVWRKKDTEKCFSLRDILEEHTSSLSALAGSSDVIFSGSDDGQICYWEFSFFRETFELRETFQAYDSAVTALQTDRHHLPRTLFTGNKKGEIHLWKKLGSQFRPSETYAEHKGEVTVLSYNSASSLLISSSLDKTVIVWKKSAFALTCLFKIDMRDSVVTDIFPSSGPREFLTSTGDGRIISWTKRNVQDISKEIWEEKETLLPVGKSPIVSLHSEKRRLGAPFKIFGLSRTGIMTISVQTRNKKTYAVKSQLPLPVHPIPNTEQELEGKLSDCTVYTS